MVGGAPVCGRAFDRGPEASVVGTEMGSATTWKGRPAARYTERMSEADRRERAKARRARGMTIERIESLDAPVAFHEGESAEERLTAMTRLCRAAWLATGRPLPPSGRAQRASLPGEVYVPDHVAS